VLLARRLATHEPVARIAASAGVAASEAYRRLGLGTAPPAETDGQKATVRSPVVREDPTLGLRATVTFDATGQAVTVRAAVPSDAVGPAHLRGMFELVLQVVRELADDAGHIGALDGRTYVLRRDPPGRRRDGGGFDTVSLDQVGGLDQVVAEFKEIAVSFRHPKVMARWGARRPQGILLYGPPGTGKTMLARALAGEIGATFREIRTPEILDKWLGASERNIKRIFREARAYREPTVLLFDEFDSIISYTPGGSDAASQAFNAVAGIFKQEMNTLIEDNPNVIVMATTNFPHRVDESLIRSGRFDIKIAIPVPDESGRAEIITKMVRQLIDQHEGPGFQMFADDVDARELAAISHGMTGADIKELLRRVQLAKAMQEARSGAPAAPISQDDLKRLVAQFRRS
jgi:transitional endoplasmic reticulum ATPase